MSLERKRTKIKFIKNVQPNFGESSSENIHKPNHKLYRFHQICMFRDPQTSKYNVRTVIFDENQNIIKSSDKEYSANQCKSLIGLSKINEYKTYSTYDLSLIDYPNSDDLLKVQSDLLSNDQTYYG